MCCVQYLVCIADTQGTELTDTAGLASTADGTEGIFNAGWSIDTGLKQQPDEDFADMGAFDSMCTDDYVEIPCNVFIVTCILSSANMYLYKLSYK